MSASRNVALAGAVLAAILAGCSQLLGADFDDGHLRDDAVDASLDTSAAEASTLDASDAGDADAFSLPPQVVIFGGSDGLTTVYDDTWTWDGATWTRHDVSPHPPAPRIGDGDFSPMATLGNTAVLFDYTGVTWVWDGQRWHMEAPVHAPPSFERSYHMATQGNHVVMLSSMGETWSWDGTDWTSVATAGAYPANTTNCFTGAGSRVIAYENETVYGDAGAVTTDHTWVYDVKWFDTYSQYAPDPLTQCAGLTALPSGVPFALDAFGKTWSFDIDTRVWRCVPSTNHPELLAFNDGKMYPPVDATMVTFAGKPFVFGGGIGGDFGYFLLDGTWVFDSGAWSKIPTTVTPALRTGHAMAAIP